MNLRALRFRIGVFVMAALVLLAILIALFGSFPDFFRHDNEFTVVFKDAPGVDTGTPVRRSGIRIGEVKDLTLDNDTGKVTVRLAIDRKYKVRHDEVPTLVHGIFGGDTAIDFLPTTGDRALADKTEIQPGEELQGTEQLNVNALLGQAAEVVPTTQEALNQISKSLKRLEQLAPATEAAIKEYTELAKDTRALALELRATNKEVQGLTKDTRSLVPEVAKTNTAIQDLANETRKSIPELKRTNDEIQVTARNWGQLGERLDVLLQSNQEKLIKVIDNLNETLSRVSAVFGEENQRNLARTLRNVSAGSENLGSISKNTDALLRESQTTMKKINESLLRADEVLANLQQASRPLAERSGSIVRNLDESTQKLNQTLTDVNTLFRSLDQADGTLRKLLTDPALYNHLDEAACMVAHILPRLDRAMKDFEIFADRLARHPELLGLGGVVHPASGVKETTIGGPVVPHQPGH